MQLQPMLTLIACLIFTSSSLAKDFCVQNAKEFENQKMDIPEVFHSLPENPAYFTIDKFVAKGGLKVRTHEKGHFVLEGYFRKGLSYHADVADIQEICFESGKVLVKFGSGKDPYVANIENSGISIDNHLISANKSAVAFNKIKTSIQGSIASQNSALNQGAN